MTDTVNNSTSYLWYDYETFGTEARKDRPVQYGSFRTDTNFNIIGQSMVLYAQLADDYIPSPGSSLVTGITPMSLMDEENALAEADFAKVCAPSEAFIGSHEDTLAEEYRRHVLGEMERERECDEQRNHEIAG